MGRGRKLENFDDFKRSLKGRYGLGVGEKYKPWLRVQDVKSEGVRSVIFGIKTNRDHHTLSSIESEFFYLAEYCDSVIDIREQFPLFPLNLSIKIANIIGVDHPKVPTTKVTNIITTDFLLTRLINENIVYEAISIKPEEKVDELRAVEKIEIERIWWEQLGINFNYYTGNEITRIQSRNISWVTDPLRTNPKMFSNSQIEVALTLLNNGKHLILDICSRFHSELSIEHDNALNLLRYLIASKYVTVDMSSLLEEADFIEIIEISVFQRMAVNGYS